MVKEEEVSLKGIRLSIQQDETDDNDNINSSLLKVRQPTNSIKASLFALIIACLGAGVLSVPHAFQVSGYLWSSIQFIICGYLAYLSNMLLIESTIKTGIKSYMGLNQYCFGKKMQQFVRINYMINNWGYVVAYIVLQGKVIERCITIVGGENIPEILKNQKFISSIVVSCFVFPLCLNRTFQALERIFMIGVVFLFYECMIICVEPFSGKVQNLSGNINQMKAWHTIGFIKTFPIAIFAYCCQANVQDIYAELYNANRKRMNKVVFRTCMITGFIYISVGFFGYLMFSNDINQINNDEISGVILLADYQGAIEISISLFMVTFSITFALPLCVKPSKDSLLDIIQPGNPNDSTMMHFILIAITTFTALFSALFVESMSTVIELIGTASSPLICFVFPGLFWLHIHKDEDAKMKKAFVYWVFVVFMSLFSIWGLIDTVFGISSSMNVENY